jgi:hypothetical protein
LGRAAEARRELELLGADPRRELGARLLEARRAFSRKDSKEAS